MPLVGVWLCGFIQRLGGLVWMQPFEMHHHHASYFVHTFPLFRSVRWYACHACLCHPLALYVSSHACLHIHAWVLLASVLSMLQHNEVMDIRSKPTFVPRGHHLEEEDFCGEKWEMKLKWSKKEFGGLLLLSIWTSSPAHLQGDDQHTFRGWQAVLIGLMLTGWPIDPKKEKEKKRSFCLVPRC